ncbi:MAG TPA: serine hydroxymethyltransferase [Thermoprotei archaeon]|nr:serine hydroxymethyltransferase [Thermoprotei archaeon]
MARISELDRILDVTRAQNLWRRKQTINLIASENVMSPLALSVYASDFGSRYAEGTPGKRFYQGVKYVDEIETLASSLLNQISGSSFSDLRPISGTIANAAAFRSAASCGDKALVVPVQAGAHVSHTKFGTLGALGIEQIFMPYDPASLNVDSDKAIKMIYEVRPKLVIMGGSLYLFPHPLKELAPHAKAVGATVIYDAAHVYGLVTGGAWPNPLDGGADIVTASTHKTFPGPQGGVILSRREEDFKAASKSIFPWFVSNHHLNRLPALAITALEMREFGRDYANAVVRNARKLAESLAARGFRVVGEGLGYTRSHQVAVDVSSLGGGSAVAQKLEEANIIVNKNMLPWDDPSNVKDPSGIRIGVQEMTRFGMGGDEMDQIAELMKQVLMDGKDPHEVRADVARLRGSFLSVKYAFEEKEPGISLLEL